MHLRTQSVCLALGLMVWIVPGCGETPSNETTQQPAADTKAPKDVRPAATDDKKAPPPKPQPESQSSPDVAVRALLDGLAQQRPKAVWDFLPASYQNDVNAVVHEFAAAYDSESWKWAIRVGESLSKLMKSKKEFFLSYPRLTHGQATDPAELERNWDSTIALLDTLLASELADMQKLKAVDVGTFLDQTGSRLMSQLAQMSNSLPNDPVGSRFGRQLTDMKVELIRQEGETAVIKLTPADTKVAPTEVNFMLVEGKWIPQPLAEGWKPGIEQIRERIAAIKPNQPAPPTESEGVVLSQLEATINAMRQTDDQEKFHKQLDDALVMLSVLFQNSSSANASGTTSPATGSTGPPSPDAVVTIVVDGRLDDKIAETLCLQLSGIVDDENLALTEVPIFSKGRTTIRVWPVNDVAAFAKRINFARVANVDDAARSIAIEVPAKTDKAN